MPRQLICPQGHRWIADGEDFSAADTGALVCPQCGATFEEQQPNELPQTIRTAEHSAETPLGLPSSIEAIIRNQPQVNQEPLSTTEPTADYEILGELGRGGMAIVYRARQVRLKRLVALKMILAGIHAGPEALTRFRSEAEAVARLQHPHIVQIYEVGERDGCPFFSLEYLDGGSLAAKLRGTPIPAPEAARLVETLARAVHYAHQCGIVHRDLKPANVLLTAAGTPKIADFGLAKQLNSDSEQTRTGQIMGTPSYMAPEQAAGDVSRIGPACDVYALGAILYELLTGRPPFRAATTLETLEQVRTQEPVPPRQLQPSTPRDIDTICLKCLQKDVRKRYADAAELAEDLRRFQAGEPIRARPVRGWERALKWVRRRPAIAALSALSLLSVLALLVTALVYNVHLSALAVRLQAALEDAQNQQKAAENNAAEAERNFQLAQQVVDKFFTQVSEKKLRDVPGFQPVRRELLQSALDYYQDFAQRHGEDAKLQVEVARSLFRVGVLEHDLGHSAQALEAHRRSLEILTRLLKQQPDDRGLRLELAKNYGMIGFIRWWEEDGNRKALPWDEKALPILVRLVEEDPTDVDARKYLGNLYDNLGLMRPEVPKERADDYLRKGRDHRQELVRQRPNEPEYQYLLAGSWINLGAVAAAGDRTKQLECYGKAAEIVDDLVRNHPRVFTYRKTMGEICTNMGGQLLGEEKVNEALVYLRKGWGVLEPLARENPEVPEYQLFLADCCNNLANALNRNRQPEEALRVYQVGQKAIEKLAQEKAENVWFAKSLGTLYANQGETLSRLGRHAEAIRAYAAAHKWQWDLAELITVAGYAASSISRVGKGEKDPLPTSEERRLREEYAHEAMMALSKAIEKGFTDAAAIVNNNVFAPLRPRQDFQNLMKKLQGKKG